jgi:hypothetical protein
MSCSDVLENEDSGGRWEVGWEGVGAGWLARKRSVRFVLGV